MAHPRAHPLGFLEKELKRAASETLLRIESIRTRLGPLLSTGDKKAAQLDMVLAALMAPGEDGGKVLLYHRFNVGELTKKLGIGDSNFSASPRVQELLECASLAQLVVECQIRTAQKLLADTEISAAIISDLVGFYLDRTFRNNFFRIVGEGPQEYRRRVRAGRPPVLKLSCPATAARIDAGTLTFEEQRLLRDTLAERFPTVFGVPRPVEVPQPIGAAEWELFQAEKRLWPSLAGTSFEEQRRVVREWPAATPSLFRFLVETSREEGRKDKRRGVEVAELALASLESSRSELAEATTYALRAEGLAWLGNAHRLHVEFPEAEAAIREAVAMVEAREVEPLTAAIVFLVDATLRMFQRRHDEAAELFERALRNVEQTDEVAWKARILRQAASSADYAGKSAEALNYLEKAKVLATTAEDLFSADYNIIVVLERAGQYEQAAAAFEQLSNVEPPSMRWSFELQWVGGNIDEGLGRLEAAEAKYRSLLKVFTVLDEPFDTGLISLDLAAICVEMAKLDEAYQLAAAVYHFFSGVSICDETLRSLEVLGQATRRRAITRTVLRDLRVTLRRDPWLVLRQEKAQGTESSVP